MLASRGSGEGRGRFLEVIMLVEPVDDFGLRGSRIKRNC